MVYKRSSVDRDRQPCGEQHEAGGREQHGEAEMDQVVVVDSWVWSAGRGGLRQRGRADRGMWHLGACCRLAVHRRVRFERGHVVHAEHGQSEGAQ
ncbi:hypothetical protein DI005_33210 [Prauserella sp. PE36]|nr:hypothetical protein DI005_33210 [Prauserella sp. PE36]